MHFLDWCIVILPVIFVLYMGLYTRRYVRSVADFLSAGRIARRYVLNVGDIANALAIITLVAYVETHYKTGFATAYWTRILTPISMLLGLAGFVTYRWRETRAMSLGQFLEMRYGSRSLRWFASALRSIAEMLTNMIMPAIAARYFIYFLDLPSKVNIFGIEVQTFIILVILCMTLAISIICMGGTLALIVTDAIQGMILYPLMGLFVIFLLVKFSWSKEIVPVMMDRVAGESFLDPMDISKLRDFNLFSMIILPIWASFWHRASWIGHGTSGAAISAHEAKMGGLLGTWRNSLNTIFYVVVAVMVITLLNHKDFANVARDIRIDLCERASRELVESPEMRENINGKIRALPPQVHEIGVDPKLGEGRDIDTVYLNTVHETLLNGNGRERTLATDTEANSTFRQFRTLYRQLMLASSMRKLLPTGLMGLFCLLLVLAMISTDDTRIYSATLTVTQDCIVPLLKKDLTPEKHILIIRIVAISIGVFFCFGSFFMSQLDYINMYSNMICSLWMGGCGPVLMFGLYSRFGTAAGAWTSLLSGMFISFFTIMIQRNWPNAVYPFLVRHNWQDAVGKFLETVSRPMSPWIEWHMDAVKCPINSYEFYFITMLITVILYIVVSYATCKEPFNLERMLHRGKYNVANEYKSQEKMSWAPMALVRRMVGITPEYTKGDKFIAWFYFVYTFGYSFLGSFLLVAIWNYVTPWPLEWWGHYFLIVTLIIPGIMAFVSTFWFGIGGVVDIIRMFKELKNRIINPLDNGLVEGGMAVADKTQLENVDKEQSDEDISSNQPTE